MPVKQFKVHTEDPPWITAEFKAFIKRCQKAFAKGNTERFRHLRNAVNRERKSLRGNYYASKVNNLKDTKPSQWWSVIKRISGLIPVSGSKRLLSNLQLEGFEKKSCNPELANFINAAFLKPMECFRPLDKALRPTDVQSSFVVSESAVLSALQKLNPRKAAGPDCVPNWLLREYAEILEQPHSSILNCSFKEQKLPPSWKLADVVRLPKQKPVKDPSKHLRPISLTPAITKLAEEFIVFTHVGPAFLSIIDPNQYGGIPRSSTLFALTLMFHHWFKAIDGTGAAVRVVLFDYREAFDLIDHNLLVQMILGLNISGCVADWAIDFLLTVCLSGGQSQPGYLRAPSSRQARQEGFSELEVHGRHDRSRNPTTWGSWKHTEGCINGR